MIYINLPVHGNIQELHFVIVIDSALLPPWLVKKIKE